MSSSAGPENTEPDDLNVGLIATVAIVGALLVIAIAASLTALVRSESARYGEEIGSFANLGVVRRLKAEQHAKLEAPPSWTDRSKGQIAIPIDRAMALVTTEIQRNPYAATVTPPAPAPTEAAPPGTPDKTDAVEKRPEEPATEGGKHKKLDGKAEPHGASAPAGSEKK